jgi:hypothetical protein
MAVQQKISFVSRILLTALGKAGRLDRTGLGVEFQKFCSHLFSENHGIGWRYIIGCGYRKV